MKHRDRLYPKSKYRPCNNISQENYKKYRNLINVTIITGRERHVFSVKSLTRKVIIILEKYGNSFMNHEFKGLQTFFAFGQICDTLWHQGPTLYR